MAKIEEVFPAAPPAEPSVVQALRRELALSRCRHEPYMHQVIGIQRLLKDPYLLLADEQGAGKTLQVVVAAQLLYLADKIDRVIIVCPAAVRPVWYDKDLGEVETHRFQNVPIRVSEYHARIKQWDAGDWSVSPGRQLRWIVSNYEFLRDKARLALLRSFCTARTLLVADESILLKNKGAQQSKAFKELRKRAGRVVLLNGTPFGESPLDLLNQANLLHPSILDCPYKTQFYSRYAQITNVKGYPEVERWKNLDDLQRRLAPYVLRRLKKDCLDLPEKMPAVPLEVRLTPKTWRAYKDMKKDMLLWLGTNVAATASQAMAKALRLGQITSGFVGGVEEVINYDEIEVGDRPEWLAPAQTSARAEVQPVIEVGREKLDTVIDFLRDHMQQEENFKLLVWCRFRPEMLRMVREITALGLHAPGHVSYIAGGQSRAERDAALRLLHPRTSPDAPVFVVGTYGTGSMGLNFTACHTVINCSYDYSLVKYTQSEDRVHRPGQTHTVNYYDLVAVGPDGQKTTDHDIVKARREKRDLSEWTTGAWVSTLQEE